MKIIAGQFNDSYTPVMDGVTNVVKNYSYWLDNKYGECYVATPAYPGYIDREAFPVLRYYSLPLKGREPYRIGLELLDINFRSTIKRIPFDIVHAHCPFTSGWLAQQIAKKKNIPIIATFHSKFYDDFKQVLKLDAFAKICVKMVIEFFNKMDQVWTVSQGATDTLREYGYKGDVEIIPNGTDFSAPENMQELIDEMELEHKIDKNDLVFLFVGQHIWQKNLSMLMKALKIVDQQNIDFKMIFAGDGYARGDLIDMSKDMGLEGKVTFLGKILNRDHLKSLFARSDLFLFPSVYDNAPIVVREAAAVSTPALVIEGSNASEGIKDGFNGFTSYDDAGSYAKKIIQISKDRDHLKNAGDNAVNTLFRSWESIVDEVYHRYVDIVNTYKRVHKIS